MQAFNAFTPDQQKAMMRHVAELHHAPIDTLEHIGLDSFALAQEQDMIFVYCMHAGIQCLHTGPPEGDEAACG
jgi:hypothetical protein